MRVDTLELVHNGAYIVYTVGQFNAQSLLNHSHESVAVHHCRKVVQAVGQGEGLRIGHILPHFLYSTVYISEVGIYGLHLFAVENSLQAEHSVG